MGKPEEVRVEEEIIGITEVTSEDESSWTAEVYVDENDTKPSAKIEVNSITNLFDRATILIKNGIGVKACIVK